MGKLTAKNKIFVAGGFWLLLTFAMFFYGFDILDASNKVTRSKIADQKRELSVLEAERDSFIKAQQDLNEIEKQTIKPEDFFSKDTTLVKEIETLENLGDALGLDLTLSGLSGTAQTAPKAKTQADIVTVRYSINISGPFARVVDFIETLENLPFITNLTSISLNGISAGRVSASMNANFYLKR